MPAKEYTWGLGRRKTSVARVRIIPGSGQITINNRPVDQFFPVERRRKHVLGPLDAADRRGAYDVFINVKGGGETGQAGACVMGLARALIKAEPELDRALRAHGFTTRDDRMVERKKYGLRKARRGCQFSKR